MQAGERTKTNAAPAPGSGPTAFEAGGATAADILALFDALPPVPVGAILDRWRGAGLPSGHPLDGLLERFGWYGKEFDGPEDVHPLLCEGRDGRVFALNPAFVPIGLVARHAGLFHGRVARAMFGLCGRAGATRRPTARLRMMEYRGVVSATMIYDRWPIYDAFRATADGALLGAMDLRGMARPFFFVLRRDGRP